MIELALVIFILIMIFTELIKYMNNGQSVFKCEGIFCENKLFSRNMGKRVHFTL
jgi:hypothetical protein